jgi:hypothetical protein
MNKEFERLKLKIAATLAIVSISLCVIATILWPISYASGVQVAIRNGKGMRFSFATTPGSIGLIVVKGEPRDNVTVWMNSRSFGGATTTATDPNRWYWTRPETKAGFGANSGPATINYDEVNNAMAVSYVGKYMPLWLFAILTFIGPTWWYLARRRREYRLEHGLCMFCGADMSASPYRCPACGKEPPW